MKVVILAGGLGTRLAEETGVRPKPMVEIGGHPILWHIMNIYASFGFREFIIALGYKSEIVKDFFLNFRSRNSDFSLQLRTGEVLTMQHRAPDWTVHLIDTGFESQTGGRLLRLKDMLANERFMLTYGDGLARINIHALIKHHQLKGKVATLTAVRPPARFGSLRLSEDGQVKEFLEKPQVMEGWINGGFFVFEPEIFGYLIDDQTILERDPLERLTVDGQLNAFLLDDFWQPMDTIREKKLLEDLWSSGYAPWKCWS